jgi:large repetitive protein
MSPRMNRDGYPGWIPGANRSTDPFRALRLQVFTGGDDALPVMSGPPFRTHLQKFGRGRPAAIVALVGLLSSLLVFLTPTPAQAVTAFTSRYNANVSGDITLAANHNMTCTTGCTTANSGTMAYVDIDGAGTSPLAGGGTVTTFNSSSADVVVPAGSTVLFAGLFWSGNLASGANQGGTGGANAPTPANMNRSCSAHQRSPATPR